MEYLNSEMEYVITDVEIGMRDFIESEENWQQEVLVNNGRSS